MLSQISRIKAGEILSDMAKLVIIKCCERNQYSLLDEIMNGLQS